MSKDNTLLSLEAALQRILNGEPKRIPASRKLSIRAVEEEANLGNGSAHYYPIILEKIRSAKVERQIKVDGKTPTSAVEKSKQLRKKETVLKVKYRDKVDSLLVERAQMAAVHHQLSSALREAYLRISALEKELVEAKRSGLVVVGER